MPIVMFGLAAVGSVLSIFRLLPNQKANGLCKSNHLLPGVNKMVIQVVDR